MPFSDFHGNAETVHRLREMLARDHFPHAVMLAGNGCGKVHTALMLARAMNCLNRSASDGLAGFLRQMRELHPHRAGLRLETRFAEAVEARENLRETDKKETRIFVQTHPDVLVFRPIRRR